MGSAAVAHCAARGQRVLGIEQFQPAHDLGSSHGRSRVIRLAYFEHPSYVPLLRRSYELWRALESDSGRRLLMMTGGLMIGTPGSEVVAGSLRSATEHHLAHELLDAAEIRKRFSPFTPTDHTVALYEPEAGVVFPEEAIGAHLDMASKSGADLHFDERVEDWSITAGGVELRTSRARYAAGRLILTPGPWASRLFKIDWLPLSVERQVLYWFEPIGGAEPFEPHRFPIYIWDVGGDVQFYGFPADEHRNVKVAFFRTGKGDLCQPDTIARTVSTSEIAAMRQALEPRLPGLAAGALREMVTCMYTLTPDHHFVIGLHPEYPQVVIASPCSGHGYKFASVIGEILADLAIEGATRHPIELFLPSRFQR